MVFPRINKDYWNHGIGAMCFINVVRDGHEPHERLAVLVPCKNENRGFQHITLCLSRSKKNWAEPGPINAWDGNRKAPTLSGSIQKDGWHGYVKNGELVTIKPKN